MRLGDVTIPLWGPLLFVVAVMVFVIVVSALNCGLDDREQSEQPGDGPDVVWEWHRKQGVIRMTAPANVHVRFGVNQRGERLEGIWTVDAEPYEIQYVGQLKCSLATWGGPCEEPPAIAAVGEWERSRGMLKAIAASYEWEGLVTPTPTATPTPSVREP